MRMAGAVPFLHRGEQRALVYNITPRCDGYYQADFTLCFVDGFEYRRVIGVAMTDAEQIEALLIIEADRFNEVPN